MLIALMTLSLAEAATLTVDRFGSGDHTSIQDAIQAASDGDSISVFPATYFESIDFLGKSIEVVSTQGASSTTIDGLGSTTNAVTFNSSEGAASVLDGFTIENSVQRGIYIYGSSPTLKNLVLQNLGSQSFDGSGAYIDAGSPLFDGVTFQDNTAYYGGGVYVVNQGTPTFTDCLFGTNYASYGGGLYLQSGVLSMSNSVFDANYTYHSGGGMFAGPNTAVTLQSTDFQDNWGYYVHGAGLYIGEYGLLTVNGGDFSANYPSYASSGYHGGGIYLSSFAAAQIQNVAFDENTALHGGALYAEYDNDITLSGNTWSNNTARYGGAIYLNDECGIIANNESFANNASDYSGGDIAAFNRFDLSFSDSNFLQGTAAYGHGGSIYLDGSGPLTLDGTTIDSSEAFYSGGGVYALGLQDLVSVTASEFSGCNSIYGSGGALYLEEDSDLSMSDSLVASNTAYYSGGGIYAYNQVDVELLDTNIDGNDALFGSGGGLLADAFTGVNNDLSVQECVFTENTAKYYGGGISASNMDHITLSDSILESNEGTATSSAGGGLHSWYVENLDVENTSFLTNTAVYGAGAFSDQTYGGNNSDNWNNNIFQENHSSSAGGALYLYRSTSTILLNNHFVGNIATSYGGSVYVHESTPEFTNNLFAYTQTSAAVEGADSISTSSAFSYNCWYNNSQDVAGWISTSAVTATGSISLDPLLSVFSQDADCSNDDLLPAPGSPLINAGDPSLLDVDGTRSDIGAFGGPDSSHVDLDGDGFVVSEDCDDSDSSVYPGALEVPYNTIDDDCDANTPDDDLDGDGHGHSSLGGDDCEDTDATINPSVTETWYDGIDSDCSGGSDDDADSDGHDADSQGGDDCDDEDASINPSATEVWYDGADSDCSGGSDLDSDQDGYDSSSYGGTDCDDANDAVYPGAPEDPYDGVDNNCDEADEYDGDGDGHQSVEYGGTDCDDANSEIHPDINETWYDGIDSDCAGDDDYDADKDGYRSVHHGGEDCEDSDPLNTPLSPGWTEDCGITGGDTGGDWGENLRPKSGGSCGCSAQPDKPLGMSWVLGLGLVLAIRRRR